MRLLKQAETFNVAGGKTAILTLTYLEMQVLVTGSTRFYATGTYAGHWLNMILYPNAIHDLNDNPLPYDISKTVFYNGHKITTTRVDDGHIYKILLGEG